jgi:hypothetical protein
MPAAQRSGAAGVRRGASGRALSRFWVAALLVALGAGAKCSAAERSPAPSATTGRLRDDLRVVCRAVVPIVAPQKSVGGRFDSRVACVGFTVRYRMLGFQFHVGYLSICVCMQRTGFEASPAVSEAIEKERGRCECLPFLFPMMLPAHDVHK